MDADWLASQLEHGRSIESIAREVGRPPSTVAYWVNKHGLTSRHAPKHAARGGLTRDQLQPLVEDGRSIREIAAELGVSPATVRHWLAKHRLRTRPRHYSLRGEPKPETIARECALHGWTTFVRIGERRYRCGRCNVESVAARRRRVKEILVREAGGCCAICGFEQYAGALHFHHVEPAVKAFELGRQGVTRSLAKAREEARKCVLLCANCHAMVEAGLLDLAPSADYPGSTTELHGRG
jgi:transposase-like protein